ncbi:glutamine-hydrolyzing carbamoyl-phosphate synthase small subunit [Mesosutterella sp. OilRF-GAM-744-9]|uniref:Carbamoyl phosphate synthase small chain n=2 Tax=Mesosutterella TaxID=2494213 RepID=A0ABS9MTN4_9BURK|nr:MULTISPECIES: glutamine-hydrolyzing carbamoyl-phosphate synthase small subunit [unclassified Mesosutterella]MCG5031358.1 glutamine-hydrolyzing carbamoyl-phosphate synthase small subunit [Mesosutterella sp. oilRF-744-WT-GAM-9]MDL2059478.1 glutamine-hydrolyzing carbamoyl-phosphate synthase small subunit [Mesosutterella sp. AGMB02718]
MSLLIQDSRPQAVLALGDGTTFIGRSIGAPGKVIAEVVFNTAMTGYQEILTDPSYTGQIVNLTYPHIGNVGVNSEDVESSRVYASGLVIEALSPVVSNFRAQSSLSDYLKASGVVGISDIDNRALTQIIRDNGAQSGCILVAANGSLTQEEIDEAVDSAKSYGGMVGQDLAQKVTTDKPYDWTEGTWQFNNKDGSTSYNHPELPLHIVAYDFGIKTNILRLLADQGMKVTVVPAKTSPEDALKYNPDGIFFSNGPGDPEPCTYAIEAARVFLKKKIPFFGICLGHQILGLALGGKTVKMKCGHHGANHPVVDLENKRVYITSQNHGFAVDADSLPSNVKVTHKSLFDGSLQGIEVTDTPAFSFQGHPEASPGPQDIRPLFQKFGQMVREYAANKQAQQG